MRNSTWRKYSLFSISILLVNVFTLLCISFPSPGECQGLPKITLGVEQTQEPQEVATSLQILAVLTILSLAPAILILMTCFTRLIVVFSFLRHALGTQQMPSNQILIGLALFLTFFVMSPVLNEVNQNALQPYLSKEITQKQALERAQEPLREFMLKQTRERDLAMMVSLSGADKPASPENLSLSTIVPAFVISELRIAFQIGFILYLPFLIIDVVVASVLMSMGMLMLPPIMISLPFKVLLFVLSDGWFLIVRSMLTSFH
jgi:flagellar biosynthetic protein FliP